MPASKLRRYDAVPATQVEIDDTFWSPRLETNRTRTLYAAHRQLQQTGRLEALELKWKSGQPNPPHIFWDSDVAKWLEAVGHSLATHPDPTLERLAQEVVDRLVAAQQENGYLNTHFTVVEPEKRWTNLRDWHELYCAGHLMEAAVAWRKGAGKEDLLHALCRYADYIHRRFGPKPGQRAGYPGHEEVELALVKLHRCTGERRYLDLAEFFINQRGTEPNYFLAEARRRGEERPPHGRSLEYWQAHAPVGEQTEVVGHAVRAMYLYSGMVDVAMETGDRTLLTACRRLWRNLTERRMYITGGIGPTGANEGFTVDYDLPNETAYAETCAAIGLVFWAHRMLQAEGHARYADVMERALYNGVLSGVSLDGERFFYTNPLAVYPPLNEAAPAGARGRPVTRPEWFGCACCPPNVARLLADLGSYIYSASRSELRVDLYVAGKAQVEMAGTPVRLTLRTGYPWKDRVRLTVRPERPTTFTLSLRLPGWCRQPQLTVNDKSIHLPGVARNGYARLRREWQRGDRVNLHLPMSPERVYAHPRVRHDVGRVALQRGPVVYCLEEVDNGPDLNALWLPRSARLRVRRDPKVFDGIPLLCASARREDVSAWGGELYRTERGKSAPASLTAIPYSMWANRRPGEMLVWIRQG